MGKPKYETIEAIAPSYWASYLINGDASGMHTADEKAADAWIARYGCGSPVDCRDAGFRRMHDAWHECPLGTDCQTYVFLRRIES